MTLEQLFSILTLLTMVAWLGLLFLPRLRVTNTVLPVLLPSLLAIPYIALIGVSMPSSDGGFATLAAVSTLFEDRRALLAGWVHYLAFDLFIGGWAVRDARQRGVPHLLVVPALVLTFLFGPAGLLLYLLVRWARGTQPWHLA
jgi:hypothetical protein